MPVAAQQPPKREMKLSEKGRRELERKQKVAAEASKHAEKWESWKLKGAEDWLKTAHTSESIPDDAKPEPSSSQNNPRVPPGNHLSRRMLVMDLDFQPEMDMYTYQLCVTSPLGTINLSLDEIRSLGEEDYTAVGLLCSKNISTCSHFRIVSRTFIV